MCGSKEVPDASSFNWKITISKIGLLCIGNASGALRAARLADLRRDGPMHYSVCSSRAGTKYWPTSHSLERRHCRCCWRRLVRGSQRRGNLAFTAKWFRLQALALYQSRPRPKGHGGAGLLLVPSYGTLLPSFVASFLS